MQEESSGEKLYFKHIAVVPRSIKGPFRTFKTAILWLGFLVYFALPWLPWSRPDAPSQAVMFDIPGRRYLIFDLVVYPQDIFWLSMLLFISAVFLFFITALFGRAFCGYFCFQTLWTDAFFFVEKWIQGERPARLRLVREPWSNAEKLLKVGGTRFVWFLISLWTALTFVFYFGYAPDLLTEIVTGSAPGAAYIATLALTISTFAAAGLLREHVCTFICPYGRFQGVMYEPDTLAVHYDKKRGEGEAGRAIARAGLRTLDDRKAKGYGDCVDCGLCVQVCPVGIDIRNGLQYTCISCGLCIDACNNIMDKMGYPKGLVRYDSETNLELPNPGPVKLQWKSVKVIGYGVSLILMCAFMVWKMSNRESFRHSVQQVRAPLYTVLSDGTIRNRYQIRLTNLSRGEETYSISARGLPEGSLDLGNFNQVHIRNGKSVIVQASVQLDPARAAGVREFEFVVKTGKGESSADKAHFFYK